MSRETAQVFDLMIKYLLQETSPATKVYLINGLFDRQYDAASPVHFRKTESVQNQGTTLEQFRSDMIMSIGQDDFSVEFQIGNDERIGLRIFEYGLRYGYDTKEITGNGALIELSLPEGCVVFWESTPTTPDTITVRFKNKAQNTVFEYDVKVFKMAEQTLASLEERNLSVLLPFCLLQFRKDLKKSHTDAQKRQALAAAERRLLDDLEGILERSQDRQVINKGDYIMVLESIAQMHKELYKAYPEFQEASMVLDDRIKLRWKTREQELLAHEQETVTQERKRAQEAIKQTAKQIAKQTETKIISLFRQGYTPDEVERLLAQGEDKTEDEKTHT